MSELAGESSNTAAANDAIATAAAIRAGQVSAREVAEAAIERIGKHNAELNLVVGTRFDEALEEIDAGLPDGPLTGVPILIKNLGMDVAGLPSTRGSRLFADLVPEVDSELVRRYRSAGMVVLGTTNTPELGLNASTESQLFGPTHNPWNTAYSTGGSSGGSSGAVAAGLVPVAHGNDGGGSIRIPSAMCGLFGLKPSRARVPAAPDPGNLARPLSINHALTTTVRDSALLLDIGAGRLPGDAVAAPSPTGTFLEATTREPGRLRIGVLTALRNGPTTSPECVAAVERMAELCTSLGHHVEPTTVRHDTGDAAMTAAVIMGVDNAVSIQDRLAQLGRELQPGDVEPFTELLYGHYCTLTGLDVVRAQKRAQQIGWDVGQAFTEYDVLLQPTLCAPTPELGVLDTTRPEAMYEYGIVYSGWTSIYNLTGMPAMSVPHGVDSRGLPMGVQFAADLGQEELLLSLAAQLEHAAPWPLLAPGY